MMRNVIGVFIILQGCFFSPFAQVYPHYYFGNPINPPFILAGTFGEVRPDHFHTGIDLSTQNIEGQPVYAAADGYVSRIKVAADGFGKALYVTHPNGYVTVYAHLKKYADSIEKYIRRNQYEKESFEIELFPGSAEFKVQKGEVIAYTGNSGSSSGPHLHFEIRDEKTEEPINPCLFGYSIPDILSPQIRSLRIIPVPMQGIVINTDSARKFEVIEKNNSPVLANSDSIQVFGKIGLEFIVVDRQEGSESDLGIYSLQLKIDHKEIFGFQYDRLNFKDTRYANAHIDYAAAYNEQGIYERCFRLPGDQLKVYKDSALYGYFDFTKDGIYDVEAEAKDFNGNTSILKFTLQCNTSLSKSTYQPQPKGDSLIFTERGLKIKKPDIEITIPPYALYETYSFTQKELPRMTEYYSSLFRIGEPTEPLHFPMTIGLKPSSIPETLKSKAVIVSFNKKNKPVYEGGIWSNNFLSAKTKHFGTFAITADTLPPIITLLSLPAANKNEEQASLRIKITDDLSGIKSYHAFIDGKWNLMEYDKKNNLLTGDLSDLSPNKTHKLELTVTDAVGNIAIFKKNFFY